MIPCIDVLGAPKYPKEVLALPKSYGIRSFATTFGDFFPIAKKWLEQGGKTLGVNLLWSDSHSFGDKNIKEIKHLATVYQALAIAFPSADIELSTFTEHGLSNPDKYHDICQTYAPSCTIVNNPSKGAFSRKYKNEVHGSKHPSFPGRYNYSGDGGLNDPKSPKVNAELVDCDITALLRFHQNCDRFYVWHSRNNGRYSMKDKSLRPQRKYWPSKDMLSSQLWLFTEEGEVDLPPKWIIKSHSEHHGKNETKGDELLIISPIKADEIVLKRGGRVIKRLEYYGPFESGGYRYYSGGFGFKLGSNLEIWAKGKKYGTCNGGFRGGTHRGKI